MSTRLPGFEESDVLIDQPLAARMRPRTLDEIVGQDYPKVQILIRNDEYISVQRDSV